MSLEFYQEGEKIPSKQAIRQIREVEALNVKQLGESLEVSPRTVEGWEQGRKVNEVHLYRIRDYLKNKTLPIKLRKTGEVQRVVRRKPDPEVLPPEWKITSSPWSPAQIASLYPDRTSYIAPQAPIDVSHSQSQGSHAKTRHRPIVASIEDLIMAQVEGPGTYRNEKPIFLDEKTLGLKSKDAAIEVIEKLRGERFLVTYGQFDLSSFQTGGRRETELLREFNATANRVRNESDKKTTDNFSPLSFSFPEGDNEPDQGHGVSNANPIRASNDLETNPPAKEDDVPKSERTKEEEKEVIKAPGKSVGKR